MDDEHAKRDGEPLLSEKIRNAITDAIASGELSAGTSLDEQVLADRYGASRTPVREALRQLAVSGIVEVRPRRGVVVASVTPAQVMDLFEATAEIEAMCVRLATYRITPLERSRLMRIHEESEEVVEKGDVDAYDVLNRQFHELLWEGTHNAYLAEEARRVRDKLAFRRTQLRTEGRLAQSRHEHDDLMRAIAQGDGEQAARSMRAHMMSAANALERFFAAD